MRRSRKFWILSHISAQIENISLVEIFRQIFSHSVKRDVFDVAVISDEGDNAFAVLFDSVRSLANHFNERGKNNRNARENPSG